MSVFPARIATTALLVVVSATPSAAQKSREEIVRMMDSIAKAPVVDGRVAGLAVAVVHGTDTLLLKGYGKADIEWDVPMSGDAVFEIGSVTKQFTAAAILQLRDEGKIDLDADITKYLPNYPARGQRVPVRRLLDHTSGIKGYTEMRSFETIIARKLHRDSLIALIGAEPFDFAPGEALIYNNSGYFLLGLIVEKVSGIAYEEYIERNIFEKLGMKRSSYCSNSEVVPRRAHGYGLTSTGFVRAAYIDHTWPYAAGSLCSSAGDLITWLRALHHGKVLPETSYKDLITPGKLNDGTRVRYAMGLTRTPDAKGRPAIHHGGGIFGFVSDTRYYPDEDLYVVTLMNTAGNLSPASISTALVDVIVPPVNVAQHSFQGDATPLVGTYTGPARGQRMTVRVARDGNGLTISINEGRAQPISWLEGLTFAAGGGLAIFDRNGNGQATQVRIDNGAGHYVLKRQPGG